MAEGLPNSALFGCFGGMSNVGTLTGLAGIEAVKRAGPGRAAIFCLGGLPTGAPTVLDKTSKVDRVVVVDGCALNCARKIVEQVSVNRRWLLLRHPLSGNTDSCRRRRRSPARWSARIARTGPDDLGADCRNRGRIARIAVDAQAQPRAAIVCPTCRRAT
jgi:hypothetical protein